MAITEALVAACQATQSNSSALASFSPGTVLVVENRTETPVWLSPGVVPACGEAAYTQAMTDEAVNAFLNGTAPKPPPDAVDLTSLTAAKPSGAASPTVVVVTAAGTTIQFGPLDRTGLPACHGAASPLQ